MRVLEGQRYLEVLHDLDQLGAVGRGQAAPLVEDGLQLHAGQLIKVQLHKPVPEGSGEHLQHSSYHKLERVEHNLSITVTIQHHSTLYLPATVQSRGILGGEEHESGVGLDDLLRLGHKQLAVVVQQPVEGLKHVCGGQVELVQDDPVAFSHGVDENALGGGRGGGKVLKRTLPLECLFFHSHDD